MPVNPRCCMFWQELIALRAAVTTLETKMWDRCRKNNWRSFETKSIGMVMQDFALIEEYTVQENLLVPLIFGKVKKESKVKRLWMFWKR